MLVKKLSLKAAALAALAIVPFIAAHGSAHADVVWTLSNVSTTAGSVTGSFTTTDAGYIDGFDITSQYTTYNSANVSDQILASTATSFTIQDGFYSLTLVAATDFTAASAPGPVALSVNGNSYEYNSDTGSMNVTSGAVTGVPAPEPISLALIGSGLVGLGVLRRRR